MSEVITPPNQYVPETDVPVIENIDDVEKYPEDKFKKIVIKIENPLNIFESELLLKIQKKFSKNGFSLQIKESEIVIYLQSLDFEAFKNYVYGLIKRFPDEPPDDFEIVHSLVFSEIVEKIEEIKSYGVRGGKRLYVIYNREKKVEGRQAKVQKRGQYYYARDNNFSKMNNKLPEKFENLIINRDSEVVLNQLPDNCIDFIITS
ncbi:MAG: hypothetical protein MUO73_08510, partial [Thermoplasmata archaeon]|nr:hypothetical protein [Thermoplasmata archaeon]